MTQQVGPPTYPAPIHVILFIEIMSAQFSVKNDSEAAGHSFQQVVFPLTTYLLGLLMLCSFILSQCMSCYCGNHHDIASSRYLCTVGNARSEATQEANKMEDSGREHSSCRNTVFSH